MAALPSLPTAQAAADWLAARGCAGLATDSRAVRRGQGFLAWPGRASDGRRYVGAALEAGAAACLVEAAGAAAFGFDDPRIAAVPGLQAAAGPIADAHYRHPSRALTVVATTGTNGKTSTAWWTAQALTALGRRGAVIGTLGAGVPDALQPTGLTTPDAVALQATLRRFVDAGYAACALEASSIGLVEHRLAGTQIDVALFTNLTRDHLDFHGSMAAYAEAKRRLFRWPGLRAAVLNIDDAEGAALAEALRGSGIDVWTVSLQRPARLQAGPRRYEGDGLAFEVSGEPGGPGAAAAVPVRSRLVGEFNASNLLVVIGGLCALGHPLADAAAAAAGVTPVPGRLQRVPGGPPEVVVDYAHTPDALLQVLQALRPLAAARGGRLWCVFGCGGNRDATKRPLMGAIAAAGADRVVLTSDNPRDESPAAILAQIRAGIAAPQAVEVIADRHAAIAHAVAQAAAADVVLLAGKGHETTQEAAGVKRPFSDLDEAAGALRRRGVAA
ncbi:MAG: UDP-N-acetylmuramoyl-L-alanyl-D-glutamate--2,6-diaminopimelate ligase [Burkholderiales bacterium]|nr:UDP-N-acetylmuramoyl-L-alanyl-D-glutamate--2,6-diaminopimelate ligase [Burkholderiales bacterium]